MVALETCEGKALMREKEHTKEWGATTGTTLRLVKNFENTGRIIIADAWFGSLRLAHQLLVRNLYSIMNVKTCHGGFPKKMLRDACPNRGDQAHAQIRLPDNRVIFGSCHRDVQPMVLVHTTGTSSPGESRYRRFAAFDKEVGHVVRKRYVLHQPDVHAKYRSLFSAVDRFNKLALSQQNSVQYGIRTEKWRTRFFMAMVAICETNAWLAHCNRLETQGEIDTPSRTEWKLGLAKELF